MYKEYIKKCKSEDTDAVKEPIYRQTFNKEYNLSFHRKKINEIFVTDTKLQRQMFHSQKS